MSNDTNVTNTFDISCFIKKLLLKNEIRDILNKIWKPDINYKFPVKTSIVGEKQKIIKLKFQLSGF